MAAKKGATGASKAAKKPKAARKTPAKRARKPRASQPAAAEQEATQPAAADPGATVAVTSAMGLPPSDPVAEDGALLLEDWTPLGQCLDWRAGLQTWAVQAERLFDQQRVPNLAHDNGTLSDRHAQVLAAWCAEQAAASSLPERIVLVELGMGTGLHLRYLLDRFGALCEAGGHDWAGRLSVYATDVSRGVLLHARDRGLFTGFDVNLGGMNALEPGVFRPLEGGDPVDLRGALHCVIANYVLDLMPMDLFRRRLEMSGPVWEAVLARTWLGAPERAALYTDLDIDGVRAALKQGDLRPLTALFPLTEVELRTFPVDLSGHPDLPLLERMADRLEADLGADHALLKEGTVVSHSGGAIQVAARIGRALAPTGFALVRDVGLTTAELAAVPRSYSHYGPTSAAGVNLVELDDWFAHGADGETPALRSVGPAVDGPRHQASRLITAAELPATAASFRTALAAGAFEAVDALVAKARAETDASAALEHFRAALNLEPWNWAMMLEAARRALVGRLDPQLAYVLARRGLALNSEYSPDLWTVYGDALWETGDKRGARQAYAYSLDVNAAHAEGHYGVAFVDAELGRFGSALRHIGETLAADESGELRAKALRLLDVCLRGQQALQSDERARLARRASR